MQILLLQLLRAQPASRTELRQGLQEQLAGQALRQRQGGLKQLEMQHVGPAWAQARHNMRSRLPSAGTDRGATGASSPCAAEGRYSSAMGCSGWVTVIVGRASSGENAKCVNGEGGDGPQF